MLFLNFVLFQKGTASPGRLKSSFYWKFLFSIGNCFLLLGIHFFYLEFLLSIGNLFFLLGISYFYLEFLLTGSNLIPVSRKRPRVKLAPVSRNSQQKREIPNRKRGIPTAPAPSGILMCAFENNRPKEGRPEGPQS